MTCRDPDLIGAMISIIRTQTVDEKTGRLAATIISVDANFNARVAERKKQRGVVKNIFRLIDFSEEILVECRAVASEIAKGLTNQEVQRRLSIIRDKIVACDV